MLPVIKNHMKTAAKKMTRLVINLFEFSLLSHILISISFNMKVEHKKKSQQHQQPKMAKPTDLPDNDLGFVHAFVASISVIIVSELGDKTFFIAAIMAMRHSRLIVFIGAILALIVMTIISGTL